MGKITVAGIGPGSKQDITPAVIDAVSKADVVIGYKYYFRFIENYLKEGAQCIDSGMKQEIQRATQAMDLALEGKNVCVISSGDSGIYGMAPLLFQMRSKLKADVEIETLPGISAFQKAASLLGSPIGHDLCIISLSDLMTPWALIEKRIRAAAAADFITAVYNPKSNGRYWQLYRLVELFLEEGRSPSTPVGCVYQAGREEQKVWTTTLSCLNPEEVDMFTVLIIGNSQSYIENGVFITPRGYYTAHAAELNNASKEKETCAATAEGMQVKLGRQIMNESFRTIEGELKRKDYPLGHKWALLHAIHTTADFDMENILYTDNEAVERIFNKVSSGELKTIVTDVTMAATGIRKGALERLGIEVKCYLSDPRVAKMAEQENITRTQAGIRLAVEEHPNALFAFGNAPTALMELCSLIRKGKANPAGIIAAPVGFVHVCESKHMVMPFKEIPKIVVRGRKGGSNLAATLCNAVLTFDDAQTLNPGRDL